MKESQGMPWPGSSNGIGVCSESREGKNAREMGMRI
jgi:hypothetical protein